MLLNVIGNGALFRPVRHPKKIPGTSFRLQHFSQRIINDWNALPPYVVNAKDVNDFKVIVLNTGIFWLLRTCSASFDHLIGEKTRMYFAKSLSDSIMNSYSLLPNITILIMQSTSMALQRI